MRSHDHDVPHRASAGHRFVGGLLHRDDLAAAREAVGRDEDLGLRVLEPLRDRVGAEPGEERQPHRAELRARHHGHDGLRRGRQEDPDRVERRHAERGEPVREPVRASRAARGTRPGGRRPSSPSQTIAVASGVRSAHRSTQLWARFTVPPPNHVAHSIPREVSRTRRYGSKNSRPRSRIAASQNHSTSEVERRISSSSVAMPCARMNRVTFARSTTSAEGLHTIVTACPASLSGRTGTLCSSGPRVPEPAYGRPHEGRHDADRRPRYARRRARPVASASARAPYVPGRVGDRLRVRHGGRRDRDGRRTSGPAAKSTSIPDPAVGVGRHRTPWTSPACATSARATTCCSAATRARGSRRRSMIAFGTDEHIGGENRSDTIILVHTEPGPAAGDVPLVPPRPLGRHPRAWVRAGSTRRSRAASTAVARSASPGP